MRLRSVCVEWHWGQTVAEWSGRSNEVWEQRTRPEKDKGLLPTIAWGWGWAFLELDDHFQGGLPASDWLGQPCYPNPCESVTLEALGGPVVLFLSVLYSACFLGILSQGA